MKQNNGYPKPQQIHSLSLLSNAAFDLIEPSSDVLQSKTTQIVTETINNDTIKSYIGNWDLLWGPIVYSNNTSTEKVVADNTMMLLYNKDENLFVVAIAGTNAVSMYGWMQEDFGVNKLQKWKDITGKDVNKKISIANGTNLGLQILLHKMEGDELQPPYNTKVDMLTALKDYAQKNTITAAEIAVAGHSLGGALSPVMALYMQDTQDTWNTNNVDFTITTWPTAGPTPGNKEFAQYLSDSMGDNYNSLHNPIDVVPQAWQKESMVNIPTIYGTNIPTPKPDDYSAVGTLVAAAYLRTIDTGSLIPYRIEYTQSEPWTALDGSAFDTKTDSDAETAALAVTALYEPTGLSEYSPYLVFLFRFLAQLGFQHTKAYNTLLSISEFADEFNVIKNSIVTGTEDERMQRAMFTAMDIHYNMPDLQQLATAEKEPATA